MMQSEATVEDMMHADACRLSIAEHSQRAAETALQHALIGQQGPMGHLQGTLAIAPIGCAEMAELRRGHDE